MSSQSLVHQNVPLFNPAFRVGSNFTLLESWRGVTDAGAGAVSAWADSGLAAATVDQSTAASRPTTGTRSHAGVNVVDLDGTNDNFNTNAAADKPAMSGLIVCCFDVTNVDQTLMGNDVGGGLIFRFNGSMQLSQHTNAMGSGGTIVAGTPTMLGYSYNDAANTYRIRQNGADVASGSTALSLTNGPNRRIGYYGSANLEFFNGWFAVILEFATATLTTAQFQDIEAYYNRILGIF